MNAKKDNSVVDFKGQKMPDLSLMQVPTFCLFISLEEAEMVRLIEDYLFTFEAILTKGSSHANDAALKMRNLWKGSDIFKISNVYSHHIIQNCVAGYHLSDFVAETESNNKCV